MKLETILVGRAIRMMRIHQPPGAIFMTKIVDALKDRYGFISVPKTLEDFDITKGIHFRHGNFSVRNGSQRRDVVIDIFSVYNNGFLADTRSYTDDASLFLDDVLQWAIDKFGVTVPSNQKIEKFYLSNLEVTLGRQLNRFFAPSEMVSKDISGYLQGYGAEALPYELVSFNMFFDKIKLPSSLLTGFIVQRRDNMPFNADLYFTSAPLRTADHLSLLEKLENL